MSALDLHGLRAAIKTLQTNQGSLARRNARTRVVDALRNVRQALDKEYPAPPRRVVTRRSKLSVREKRKQLITDGFVIAKGTTLAKLAEAGVAVRYTKGGSRTTSGTGSSNSWFESAAWVPGWAAYYLQYGGISKVAEARRSMTLIKAARAAMRLSGFTPMNGEISCPHE